MRARNRPSARRRPSWVLTLQLVLILASAPSAVAETTPEEARIAAVLDDFHAAASAADEERYFDHLAPRATFLGTDASERWTKEEFRAFAHPYFARGQGWTYRATSRHVTVAGETAWFDEALENASYGECRGSGVLRLHDGAWKIEQYNLTIPIPNELAEDFVARIRALGSGEP